jgi:hypothetical protein
MASLTIRLAAGGRGRAAAVAVKTSTAEDAWTQVTRSSPGGSAPGPGDCKLRVLAVSGAHLARHSHGQATGIGLSTRRRERCRRRREARQGAPGESSRASHVVSGHVPASRHSIWQQPREAPACAWRYLPAQAWTGFCPSGRSRNVQRCRLISRWWQRARFCLLRHGHVKPRPRG